MSGEASEKLALDAIRAHAFSHVCLSGKTGAMVPIAAIKEILATFEAETRKEERESCAKVADYEAQKCVPLMRVLGVSANIETGRHRQAIEIAAAIRNLGEGSSPD